MRSMTGFGRGDASVGNEQLSNQGGKATVEQGGEQIVVELKSVNHRFLEIRTKLPGELSGIEVEIEKQIRSRISRGYCNVHITCKQVGAATQRINKKSISAHIEALKQTAKQSGVPVESLMGILNSAPDLYEFPVSTEDPKVPIACAKACDIALDKLITMREIEGAHMAEDIKKRLTRISSLVDQIAVEASSFEKSVLKKFTHKIAEIVSHNQSPDQNRIETEAAIIAEKADITEEITRLRSHVEQMNAVFLESIPVGRRMDFLIQEMGRETNTIASKSVLAKVTHMVVGIKGELEKIRELVQNVE